MPKEYRIITLCGSTKFKEDFIRIQKELTLKGNIIMTVGLFGHSGDNEVFSDYEKIRVPAVLNSEKMGVFVEGEDVVKSLYKLLCHNNPNVFTSTSAEMKNPGLYIFYNNAPHGSSWTKRAVREGKEAEQMLVSLVYLQRQYADLKRNEVYTKLLKK